MRLRSRLPLAYLLAASASALGACGDGGEDVCAARHETYHVAAALSMREPGKSAGEGAPADAGGALGGKLMVTVQQDRGITSCHDGLVSEINPAPNVLNTMLAVEGGSFALDVPSTFYPGVYTSSLWLDVRLDENDNGKCDDGEPAGMVALPRNDQVAVEIELVRAACSLPRI